jgi:Domain of unknown function (DUF4604)
MAFNAKNLHYEKKVPAFLQRLQGQYTGDERNSAAQQRLQQRPKKLKNDEDDDDAPTYVNEESGEVVGKEEYERLVRGEDGEEEEKEDGGIGEEIGKLTDGDEKGERREKSEKDGGDKLAEQKIAEIGAGRKRKVGKVVGGDEAGDGKVDGMTRAATSGNAAKGRNGTGSGEKAADPKKTSTKAKGGKKKIKLSFDED